MLILYNSQWTYAYTQATRIVVMLRLEVSHRITLTFNSEGRLTSIVSVMQVCAILEVTELVKVPCSKVLGVISVWEIVSVN